MVKSKNWYHFFRLSPSCTFLPIWLDFTVQTVTFSAYYTRHKMWRKQSYCSHRNSPHRGEFATFAKTVAIRGDFMLKCGKWRILLDQRWDREVLGTSLVIAGEVKWMANSHIGPNFLISYWEEHVGPNKQISEVQASRIVTWHPSQGLNPWPPRFFKIWRMYIPTNTYPHKPLV